MNHLLLEMNYLELCQNFCEMVPVAGARLELSNSILLSNLVFIPFIPGHWEKSFSIRFECVRDDSIVFCTSVQWFSQAAQLTRGEPDKTVIGQAIKFTLSSLKSLNGKVKCRCLKTGRSAFLRWLGVPSSTRSAVFFEHCSKSLWPPLRFEHHVANYFWWIS